MNSDFFVLISIMNSDEAPQVLLLNVKSNENSPSIHARLKLHNAEHSALVSWLLKCNNGIEQQNSLAWRFIAVIFLSSCQDERSY